MSLYIFLLYNVLYLSSMLYVYRFLWPLRLGWLLVCCLYKEVYLQIFKRVSFWLHGCCGEWEGWAHKPGQQHQLGGRCYSNWPCLVGQQPLYNRTFCGVVCVVTLPLWHFCWCMGFCHRTESDLFLFLFVKQTAASYYPSFVTTIYSHSHHFTNSSSLKVL